MFEEKNPHPSKYQNNKKKIYKKKKAWYPKQITACIKSLFHHNKHMVKKPLWMKTRCNNFLDSLTSKGFFYGLFLHLINIPTLTAKAPVIPQVVSSFFLFLEYKNQFPHHHSGFKARTVTVYLEHFTCLFAVGWECWGPVETSLMVRCT